MKRIAYLFVLAFLASSVYAQTPPAPTPPAPTTQPAPPASPERTLPELLNWMLGEWEGQGMARGEREFIGKLTVIPELDSTALLVRRESTNKEGGMAGGLKELMIVGYDGTTKKIVATVYDSKNTIALYVGELKTNEILFTVATAQQGYVSRRSFRQMPDGGMAFVIESGSPGKETSKSVEINFKKKI